MKFGILVAAVTLIASSTAMAQEIAGIEYQRKANVFGGVGFGSFSQNLGDLTDTGFGWGARVGAQPTRIIGAEIAYQGLNAGTGTVILNGNAIGDGELTEHQVTANAKVGYPLTVNDREMRPYGLIGLGYARINADDVLQNAGFSDDNLFAVPLGVGVQYALNDTFSLDGRFTYNFLSGEDQPIANDEADTWNALINVGAVFGAE